MSTTTVPVPWPTNSLIRSEMELRQREDGSSEITAVRQYASVDGEWIDVRELVSAWRSKTSKLDESQAAYLRSLRVSG